MADFLRSLNSNPATAAIARALGLPNPVELQRAEGGYAEFPFAGKTVLLCSVGEGFAASQLRSALEQGGAAPVDALAEGQSADIIAVDATGCKSPADYRALYDIFHPVMRQIARNARILLCAAQPAEQEDAVAAAAARGIEGFSRSLAREVGKKGATANLAYVGRDAADRLDGVLRFFCAPQSTYVTGQAFALSAQVRAPASKPLHHALAGKVALVTGGARGIGAATAERLAQEGARVVCLDVPAAADALHETCTKIGAIPLMLDITAVDAPAKIADFCLEKFAGLDILVHNAGITRDKTLANMPGHYWDLVVNINLAAILAIDTHLLERQVMRDDARIVCLSSIGGVAGNFGQTNYAATKAALIGYVAALAPQLATRGIAINAVAPGFIETQLTDQMPFMPREVGRRMNALSQGGRPRDAAELITFLCTPAAGGISGATIRVCGQAVMGA